MVAVVTPDHRGVIKIYVWVAFFSYGVPRFPTKISMDRVELLFSPCLFLYTTTMGILLLCLSSYRAHDDVCSMDFYVIMSHYEFLVKPRKSENQPLTTITQTTTQKELIFWVQQQSGK